MPPRQSPIPCSAMLHSLFVCVFSVTHSNDVYYISIVVNCIDNAVIADPKSPKMFVAGQFFTAGGARFGAKIFNSWEELVDNFCIERSSSFRAERAKVIMYLDMQLALFPQPFFDRINGFSRLIRTLP
jgi:hypothetical protein